MALAAGASEVVDTIALHNLPVSAFDTYIKQVRVFVDQLRQKNWPVEHYTAVGNSQALIDSLPIKVGEGAFSGMVMRKNTYVELGNPAAGSCAFPLWSNDLSLVVDGNITLLGPDIPESEGGSLPFGQIVLVAGQSLSKSEQTELELKQFVANQIEGYMIRSAPGRVWSRVSRDVIPRGFNFEVLGKALVAIFKQIRNVEAVEVIFITSSKGHLKKLEEMAGSVRRVGENLAKEDWRDRGFDPDACIEHDCSTCEEEEDCDDIREVVQLQQKALREQRALRRQQKQRGIVRKIRR